MIPGGSAHPVKLPALAAVLCSLTALPAARATDLAGRYVVATLPAADAPAAQAAYAGTADITPRKQHVSTVTWQPAATGARRLRGLGLSDDDGAFGVSLATGGAVYGVAIYHHAAGSHEWQGRWITSLDGGGNVGDIRFDDAGGGSALAGRHRLVCHRPGSGGFEGAVNITPRGDDFLLAFEVDRTVLYRGVGILLDPDRLIVGWSFGSPPALAVYRPDPSGLLTGRRISSRPGQPVAIREAWAREGEEAMRLLPAAARTDPALLRASADADLEPGSPEIKTWTYDDLQARHSADGWARRWLDEQLTPEERNLLERAVHRRRPPTAGRTIGDLIAEERRRSGE